MNVDPPVSVSLTSPALAFGSGLFETCALREGRVEFFREHWARLCSSAEALGIEVPLGEADACAQICEFLRQRETAGQALKILLLDDLEGPRLLWHLRARRFVPENSLHRLTVAAAPLNEASPLAGHKTLNYWVNRIGLAEAASADCFDALVFNTRGELAETWTSNVFLVREGQLLTPPEASGLLPGVARAVLISAARAEGIAVRVAPLHRADLETAEAVFLTNSLIGVHSIDEFIGSEGQVCAFASNPFTSRCHALFEEQRQASIAETFIPS